MNKFIQPCNFRQLILLSLFSQTPFQIQTLQILPQELQFLKLLEIITQGSTSTLNKSLTYLKFYPGIITNNMGNSFKFQCKYRSITYFLEYLIIIALMGKQTLQCNLIGITNDNVDPSVDTIIYGMLPFLKKYYSVENLKIKIINRGYPPQGKGQLKITCAPIRKFKQIVLIKPTMIKRIRGIAVGSHISPNLLQRVVSKCRQIFNDYIPDVWIYTDITKNKQKTSGYSLSLVAQSINGTFLTADKTYQKGSPQQFVILFKQAQSVCLLLLDQIEYAGVVSTSFQSHVLTLMALSQQNTSRILLGRISGLTIENCRSIKQFLGLIFQLSSGKEEEKMIWNCVGSGMMNLCKEMT